MKNSSNTYSLCDTNGQYHSITYSALIEADQRCIREGFSAGQAISSPQAAASQCQILLVPEEQEVFYAIWLNSQHQVIHHGELSRGTIDGASVYPREVVKTGLVLHADDPWWQTHYAPNGWGCQCYVEALSARDLKRLGKTGPDTAPPLQTRTVTVGATGPTPRSVSVPAGIDPGFAYAPGRESALGKAVQHRLLQSLTQTPQIAAAGVQTMLARPIALAALGRRGAPGGVSSIRPAELPKPSSWAHSRPP